MPLSAQGVLKFLNDQHRRYEVFEQISLTGAGTGGAPLSTHVLFDSAVVPKSDCDGAGGGGNAGSTADGVIHATTTPKVTVRTPSSRVLQLPWPPLQLQGPTPTQAHGTMYVCELPEGMWNSIAAITPTTAPSQQQLVFSTEAPAFCTSQDPSFEYPGDDGDGERSERSLPITPTITPIGAIDHKDYAEEMQGEPGRLSNYDKSLFASTGDPGSVAAVEGIQLPQFSCTTGQRVMELSTSPQALQAPGEDLKKASHAMQAGWKGTDTSSIRLQSQLSQPPGAAAAEALVKRHSDTVTVVLWVAGDAAARAVGTTVISQVEGVSYPFTSASQATPPCQRDPQFSPFTATAFPKAAASAVTPVGSTDSGESLPGCLCFAVRDIDEAESNDTDFLTPRDRRVQMLTLQLESGAVAYAAKCISDALVRVSSNSPWYGLMSPPGIGGDGVSPLVDRPVPSSISFVFHKGGITRCIATLRQNSPGLIYACRGGRNTLSLSLLDGASGATGADGSRISSPSTSRGAANPFEPPASHGVAQVGSALLRPSSSPAGGGTTSAGASQMQLLTGEMQGWRKRLTTSVLFHGGISGVRGLLPHYVSTQRNEAMSTMAPHSSYAWTTSSPQASLPKQRAGDVDGRYGKRGKRGNSRTRAGASTTNSPASGQDKSSASSFEDLTDEMTAIRLGSCYSPPRPVLAQDGGRGGGSAPVLLTAADWELVFDAPCELQRYPQQHGDVPENHTTHGATSTPAPPQARRLNADRWRAFRQAVYERGGLADDKIRFEVWCYLLGAYAVGSTEAEQAEVRRKEEDLYMRLTSQWKSFLPEQEKHFAAYRGAKLSIMKDVQRTDRAHPAFCEDDSDMLRVLQELLLAHVMLDMDLGYSQGMSDVAAVALLVTSASLPPAPHPLPASEAAMFMCYRRILSEHMSTNFTIEARMAGAPYAAVKGLQRKLYQTQVLVRHFHPGLYKHLTQNCMVEDMSFCLRWILVCFKRDLPSIADTMRFWDVLFACPYTTSYEVVVTVALLGALAPQIITHIQAPETLLQFTNVLSSGASLDQILVCARQFYENVCVVEARELRLCLRRQAAGATAIARGGARTGGADEPMPGCSGGPNAKAAATPVLLPAGKVDVGDDDADYFPSVEEMVQLFLQTDGPL
ncbi:RabGTPaseTBC domain containing protein [Leishmania braziliensis]|nr:RabGTPaseTBC domain containing protein [Leishmania braziliensis]